MAQIIQFRPRKPKPAPLTEVEMLISQMEEDEGLGLNSVEEIKEVDQNKKVG